MSKIAASLVAVLMVVTFCAMNCDNGGNPMSPVPPPVSPVPPPTTPVPPPVTPEPDKGCEVVRITRAGIIEETRCSSVRFYVPGDVVFGDGYFNIWIPEVNNGRKYGPFQFNRFSKWIDLKEGTHNYQIAGESLSDGVIYQCDRHHGDFTIECKPPPPPECVKTPKPADDCTWSQSECKWTCTKPCEPVGKPLCKEQKWDPTQCKWVGECPCKPTGKPLCPEQTWNHVTCTWVGECPCEAKECSPGYSWNKEKCECECSETCKSGFHLHQDECKCYCDPVGEPECKEQTWSEDTCSWEGKCPCIVTECPKFMKWSHKQCKCVGVDICHVSNKGKPGKDWNIQETQVKFTPGHENHLDPDLFCPPDYIGKCWNRYKWFPHKCMKGHN